MTATTRRIPAPPASPTTDTPSSSRRRVSGGLSSRLAVFERMNGSSSLPSGGNPHDPAGGLGTGGKMRGTKAGHAAAAPRAQSPTNVPLRMQQEFVSPLAGTKSPSYRKARSSFSGSDPASGSLSVADSRPLLTDSASRSGRPTLGAHFVNSSSSRSTVRNTTNDDDSTVYTTQTRQESRQKLAQSLRDMEQMLAALNSRKSEAVKVFDDDDNNDSHSNSNSNSSLNIAGFIASDDHRSAVGHVASSSSSNLVAQDSHSGPFHQEVVVLSNGSKRGRRPTTRSSSVPRLRNNSVALPALPFPADDVRTRNKAHALLAKMQASQSQISDNDASVSSLGPTSDRNKIQAGGESSSQFTLNQPSAARSSENNNDNHCDNDNDNDSIAVHSPVPQRTTIGDKPGAATHSISDLSAFLQSSSYSIGSLATPTSAMSKSNKISIDTRLLQSNINAIDLSDDGNTRDDDSCNVTVMTHDNIRNEMSRVQFEMEQLQRQIDQARAQQESVRGFAEFLAMKEGIESGTPVQQLSKSSLTAAGRDECGADDDSESEYIEEVIEDEDEGESENDHENIEEVIEDEEEELAVIDDAALLSMETATTTGSMKQSDTQNGSSEKAEDVTEKALADDESPEAPVAMRKPNRPRVKFFGVPPEEDEQEERTVVKDGSTSSLRKTPYQQRQKFDAMDLKNVPVPGSYVYPNNLIDYYREGSRSILPNREVELPASYVPTEQLVSFFTGLSESGTKYVPGGYTATSDKSVQHRMNKSDKRKSTGQAYSFGKPTARHDWAATTVQATARTFLQRLWWHRTAEQRRSILDVYRQLRRARRSRESELAQLKLDHARAKQAVLKEHNRKMKKYAKHQRGMKKAKREADETIQRLKDDNKKLRSRRSKLNEKLMTLRAENESCARANEKIEGHIKEIRTFMTKLEEDHSKLLRSLDRWKKEILPQQKEMLREEAAQSDCESRVKTLYRTCILRIAGSVKDHPNRKDRNRLGNDIGAYWRECEKELARGIGQKDESKSTGTTTTTAVESSCSDSPSSSSSSSSSREDDVDCNDDSSIESSIESSLEEEDSVSSGESSLGDC